MSYVTILGISAGLAMDAFAVSISYGCTPKNVPLKHILLISLSFGAFQAFMPVIGWQAGRFFTDMIKDYDHWLAFALLAYIGTRMILEGIKSSESNDLIWFAFPNQMYLPLFSVQETMANFKMLKGNFCQSILAEYGPVNVTSEILMHV